MKKGFTLIELLAVIVILAIIALIVTPIVSNIIASARNSANQRSVEGHMSNIEYAIMTEAFDSGKDIGFMDGEITNLTLLLPSNDRITCDSYTISAGLVMEARGCSDIAAGWSKAYDYKKNEGSNGGVNSTPKPQPVAGDTEVTLNGITSYKGTMLSPVNVVYFNVTTGAECIESDYTSNASANEGCLKFYAYMEDELSYTMIDEKCTPTYHTSFGSDTNVNGPTTSYVALASDTGSWQGTVTPKNYTYTFTDGTDDHSYTIPYETDGYKARFITMDEIVRITNHPTFNPYSSTSSDWYYFDSLNQTQTANGNNKSNYGWLFDYLNTCDGFGCDHHSGVANGYWTSDAMAGTTTSAWFVHGRGNIGNNYNGDNAVSYGESCIRPVITVLKTKIGG